MIWVGVAALVAAILLTGLGFAAFWPKFPPIDDTPIPSWMLDKNGQERVYEPPLRPRRHRAARTKGRRRRGGEPRAAEVDEFLEVIRDTAEDPRPDHPLPMEPTAETWMWSAEGAPARHRWEHVGEGTQPLNWHTEREGGPPEWPPRRTE